VVPLVWVKQSVTPAYWRIFLLTGACHVVGPVSRPQQTALACSC